MICPVCGKEIADGLAVCPICGVALTAPQAPVSTAAPQDAAPQNAAPQYAPQQNAAPQYAPQQYTAPQQFAAPQSPAVMPKNAKQFIKQMSQNPEYKKIGGGITVSALVFYLSAALTMALATFPLAAVPTASAAAVAADATTCPAARAAMVSSSFASSR